MENGGPEYAVELPHGYTYSDIRNYGFASGLSI